MNKEVSCTLFGIVLVSFIIYFNVPDVASLTITSSFMSRLPTYSLRGPLFLHADTARQEFMQRSCLVKAASKACHLMLIKAHA